ncbi:VanZ family protein [Paucibacter sp. R3-3]|uniref:VanZ family protein n=1 Tax=Roseateles agri TaxID=3098619 RepID=A0ABU5DBU3_9BURK|nr:VanZ family protein [Paucibacter sp. R3-3]MDY0743749.1 VanZ family protein [Paucibacter sp. R3-3]
MNKLLNSALFGTRLAPLRALVFVALVIVISWLAFSPAPPPGASLGWDKANHASAFAALMVSGRLAWPRLSWRTLIIGLLAYGGAIELIQTQLPPREGDWLDLLADTVGLGLGTLVFLGLRRGLGAK